MIAALLLICAVSASAQSPMPYSGETPAVSTAPVVAASTETAVAVSTEAAKPAPKPAGKPRLHAVIHPQAKDWTPLSLKAWGDPERAQSSVVVQLTKTKGLYKGRTMKARAVARLRKRREDSWLIVSVFPKELEARRKHFEIALRLVEGYVEEVKASFVSVVDRRAGVGAGLDARELEARGIEYEEDFPSSGELLISSLDPRPSASALNSGTLKLASFAEKDVQLADVSWSATGLAPAR